MICNKLAYLSTRIPTFRGSRKWMYFTTTDKFQSIKLRIWKNTRNCTDKIAFVFVIYIMDKNKKGTNQTNPTIPEHPQTPHKHPTMVVTVY